MSMNETTDNSNDVDLDSFSADFFGQKTTPDDTAEPASSVSKDTETNTTEVDAPTEDTQIEDNDTLATHDDDDTDADEAGVDDTPIEPVKPKKNRFQERIDELTSKAREAERREQALRDEFEALKNQVSKPTTNKEPANAETSGPNPDDVDEDGTDKYPLGEFDPKYIRDLTRYTLAEEKQRIDNQAKMEAERVTKERAAQAVAESWNQKLAPAEERYPDFREKGEELVSSLEARIEPEYSQYLSNVLMSLDYGPDVLYYLANNPSEALEIVAKGAQAATRDLYRIEAKFAIANEEKKTARPKISQAPTPPAHTNKGSAVARIEVPADTDDLDAFANSFFKKRR